MKPKVEEVSSAGGGEELGERHPNSSKYYEVVPLVKPARKSEEDMAALNNKIFLSKFYPSS